MEQYAADHPPGLGLDPDRCLVLLEKLKSRFQLDQQLLLSQPLDIFVAHLDAVVFAVVRSERSSIDN